MSEKQKSGSPANIYGLCADRDRLALILSKSLYEKWAALDETNIYTVDISIECNGMTRSPDLPEMKTNLMRTTLKSVRNVNLSIIKKQMILP